MFDNTMSVEQWKEQKQAERNDAFKAQQSCMEEALSSGKALTAYLLGRGRLVGRETASWICIVAAAPLAAAGFFVYDDLTFDRPDCLHSWGHRSGRCARWTRSPQSGY